jgi:putative phosphoesterase
MKILIISDTHHDIYRAETVIRQLKKAGPLDILVHCGDYYDDAVKLGNMFGIETVAVRGNCDRSFTRDEFAILETEAGDFFVTHGNMYNVGYSNEDVYDTALQYNCTGAIFGHTHRAENVDMDGFLLLNPGSLTRPRDGSDGTFAILNTSEAGFEANIIRYDDFIKGNARPAGKAKAGHLRELFNWADGQ